METSDKNSLKARLKVLQQAIDLFSDKELTLIKENTKDEYYLNPLPLNGSVFKDSLNRNTINLKKYVLQGTGKYDSVDTHILAEGSLLEKELSELVDIELGDNYVTVFCKEFDRYLGQQDMFGVKFYSIFDKGQSGLIKFDKTRTIERVPDLAMNISNPETNKIEINVDKVYSKMISYNGDDFYGRKVLFYGFDIEENKYLNYLFRNRAPECILNIIPFMHSAFLQDNVD